MPRLGLLLLCWQAAARAVEAPAASGAGIDESLVKRTFYVNPNGADDAPGSVERPVKTLARAAALAFQSQSEGVGVKVVVGAGVYREKVGDFSGAAPDVPVVFEAAEAGKAVLSGSDTWSDWTPAGDGWSHAWPRDWNMVPAATKKAPTLRERREMVFVNDVLLRQVLSSGALADGTFYVDETARQIVLRPYAETDMKTARVEVGARGALWHLTGKKNLVLRGLVFKHDASLAGSNEAALKFNDCRNVLVEDCRFEWNNNLGLQVGRVCEGVTLRRSVCNDNGWAGVTGSATSNVIVEDCETSRNNWRGAWDNYFLSPGGSKWSKITRGVWRRHIAQGNLANGVWISGDSRDVSLQKCFVHDNRGGLHIESSLGPILVANSIICHNTAAPGTPAARFGAGLLLSHSALVNIIGNICLGNDGAQISVRDDVALLREKDPVSGIMSSWRTRYITLNHNACAGLNAAQQAVHIPAKGFDAGSFATSFVSNNNLFWNAAQPLALLAGPARSGAAAPSKTSPPIVPAKPLDLDAWQAATGQDAASIFADPRFVDAAGHNFQPQPGSPLAAWGLPQAPPSAPVTALSAETANETLQDAQNSPP